MRYGSHLDPPNRFERIRSEPDEAHLEWDAEYVASRHDRHVEFLADDSQSIVSENKSPDIPFRFSINPYRGCEHGCAYCYARPGHEFLGWNAGLDFETKIVVKHDAPELLRKFLARDAWQPHPITFSGVTDCYQPAERKFGLTRKCLEVAAEFRQPISIVTKNALVVRDIDLLRRLAADRLVHVFLSLTTLQRDLARDMEPRTSIPPARLRAVNELASAGIPVGVMVAPVIPGLNDSEIPRILAAAAESGAIAASYILLRLPLTVETVFAEWIDRTHPLQAERVLQRVRDTRDGNLNSGAWGERMVGTGPIAEQIQSLFSVFQRRHGLDGGMPPLNRDAFRRPVAGGGQLRLF